MSLRQRFEGHLLALLRERPVVHAPSAQVLAHLCQQQLAREDLALWRTFWSLAAHFFTHLCDHPNRGFEVAEASAASQVLSGVLLREQFDNGKTNAHADLQTINHMLFLEQADVLSQRLVGVLNDWSAQPEADLPDDVQLDAQSMAQLAQEVQLTGVQQVADGLAAQLARLRTQRVVADIQASLKGAEEVSRLLQHFAVGAVREPQPQVLAALKGD
jgi:hypothetical protein